MQDLTRVTALDCRKSSREFWGCGFEGRCALIRGIRVIRGHNHDRVLTTDSTDHTDGGVVKKIRAPGCARRWWGGKSQNAGIAKSQKHRIASEGTEDRASEVRLTETPEIESQRKTRKAKPNYSNKTRKPKPSLRFRLSGKQWLRSAQRTPSDPSFQEPPRSTREYPELGPVGSVPGELA